VGATQKAALLKEETSSKVNKKPSTKTSNQEEKQQNLSAVIRKSYSPKTGLILSIRTEQSLAFRGAVADTKNRGQGPGVLPTAARCCERKRKNLE